MKKAELRLSRCMTRDPDHFYYLFDVMTGRYVYKDGASGSCTCWDHGIDFSEAAGAWRTAAEAYAYGTGNGYVVVLPDDFFDKYSNAWHYLLCAQNEFNRLTEMCASFTTEKTMKEVISAATEKSVKKVVPAVTENPVKVSKKVEICRQTFRFNERLDVKSGNREDNVVYYIYVSPSSPDLYLHKDGTLHDNTGYRSCVSIGETPGLFITFEDALECAVSHGYDVC